MDAPTLQTHDFKEENNISSPENNNSTANENVDDRCSICIETFNKPKLLRCGHTFCLDCLHNMITSSHKKEKIVCPICRSTTMVPKNGLSGFITNYFIRSSGNSTCQVCDVRVSTLNTCSFCRLEMCPSCYSNHQQDRSKRCVKPDYKDKEMLDYEFQLRQVRVATQTFYCGKMKFSYRCPHGLCIKTILPLAQDEAWILTEDSSEIVQLNYRGNHLFTTFIGESIEDICQINDGSLVALCSNSKSLYSYKDSKVTKVLKFEEHRPWRLLALHGSLAVAVTTDATGRSTEWKILFYDYEFKFMFSVGSSEIGSFVHINSMCYKPDIDAVCLADETGEYVRFIRSTHESLTFVNNVFIPFRVRDDKSNRERYKGFKPRALCCDSDGNLYVFDDASGMILIVDSSAKCVGMILGDDDDKTGDPNCITFDINGKLWIGDRTSGRVRVYTIDKIYNDLVPEALPDSASDALQQMQAMGLPDINASDMVSSCISANPDNGRFWSGRRRRPSSFRPTVSSLPLRSNSENLESDQDIIDGLNVFPDKSNFSDNGTNRGPLQIRNPNTGTKRSLGFGSGISRSGNEDNLDSICLSTGPLGTFLRLPSDIVNDYQQKQRFLHQISMNTGISVEELENGLIQHPT